jgi:hypothetical protein
MGNSPKGIEYYKMNPNQEVIGVMHPVMANYSIHDIDFVAAFDVDSKKVGKKLSDAVYAEPNKVKWVPKLSAMHDVTVKQSPQLDGVGHYVEKVVMPVAQKPVEELKKEKVDYGLIQKLMSPKQFQTTLSQALTKVKAIPVLLNTKENLSLLSKAIVKGNKDYAEKKDKYFRNNIELFSNSIRVFAEFQNWKLADLQNNQNKVIKKIKLGFSL